MVNLYTKFDVPGITHCTDVERVPKLKKMVTWLLPSPTVE